MKRFLRAMLGLGTLFVSVGLPLGTSATTYDVAAQFDPANNPSHLGPWTYGFEVTQRGIHSLQHSRQ